MKKILCLIDSLTGGGAQRQIVYLASLLQKKGYEVKVVTYHDISFYKAFLDDHGVENEFIQEAEPALMRIYYISKYIRNYRPDTVISYLDTPSIIACLTKRITHGKWNLIVSDRNTTQQLSLRDRIKFCVFRWADKIVPNSYSQANYIKSNYSSLSAKTIPIINVVDLNRFQHRKIERNNVVQILVVASVLPSKNTRGFIETVKMVRDMGCKDFHVDWYGLKDTAYCGDCQALIQQYELSSYIRLLPKDPHIEKKYNISDWLCLPSFYEGTPNAICEGMACGLPILCSEICDNSIYVREGENGYMFDPKSVESMSEALIKAIQTTAEIRCEMGKKSRKLAETLLSKERFISEYCSIIEE